MVHLLRTRTQNWESIEAGLFGIWTQNNDAKNVAQLCQHIPEMQKVYNQTASPANVAKMILNELRGLTLYPVRRSFCFSLGIAAALFFPRLMITVWCGALQGAIPRLSMTIHPEHLRNKKGGIAGNGGSPD